MAMFRQLGAGLSGKESRLRRDLPNDTKAEGFALICCAIKMPIRINDGAAVRVSHVTAATKIVQKGASCGILFS